MSFTYQREREIDSGDENPENYANILNPDYGANLSQQASHDNLLNEINKLKKMKSRVASLEANEGKLNKIEKEVKNNNEKLEQLSKTMNDIKTKGEDVNRSFLTQSLEYDKLNQENLTLKADAMIYVEDINHLTNLNKKYEDEINLNRKKIMELVNLNESYQAEIAQKDLQISQLTEAITRLRLFDNPDAEYTIECRANKYQRMRELEFDNKKLIEANAKFESERKILEDKVNELQRQNDSLSKELEYTKIQEGNQITEMEHKIQEMEREVANIQRENTTLKITNETYFQNSNNYKAEKEALEGKYEKKEQQVKDLSAKNNELLNMVNQLQFENNQLKDDLERSTKKKQVRDNGKQKLFQELQNKIQNFKTHVRNNRDKDFEE